MYISISQHYTGASASNMCMAELYTVTVDEQKHLLNMFLLLYAGVVLLPA